MNHALESLMEARDHARCAAAQFDAAISLLKGNQIGDSCSFGIAELGAAEKAEPEMLGLGDRVKLSKSGECGEVIGAANYARQPRQYLVEYVAADGRQVVDWFSRDSLRVA